MTTHAPQRDPAVLDDQHRRSLLDREPTGEDRVVSGRCALARPQERPQATALGEARPGELVLCNPAGRDARVGEAWCRVTDRLRDEPSVVYQDADDPLAHPARLGIRRMR